MNCKKVKKVITKNQTGYAKLRLIISSIPDRLVSDILLAPLLVEILPPALSPPEPDVVLVIDIGAIVTAPPKFTIPPEIVPIVIPSRLTAVKQTLLPSFFSLYVQGRVLV